MKFSNVTLKKNFLRKSDFKKLAIFMLLLFALFSPHLNLMGIKIKTVYLFIILPAIFGILIVLQNKKMQAAEFYFLLAILISLVHSVLLSFMTGAEDIGQVVATVRGILLFFCSYFFVHIYKRIYQEHFLDTLLLHILYAILINCLLILVLFLAPDLKATWHSVVVLSETQKVQASHNNFAVRLSGLVHSGFGALSVVNALGLVIALYLHLYSTHRTISLLIFIFCTAILFVATILVGRLGLVVMIGCIGLFLLTINRKRLFFKYLKMTAFMLLALGSVATIFYINFGEKFIFGFMSIFDFFIKENWTPPLAQFWEKPFHLT